MGIETQLVPDLLDAVAGRDYSDAYKSVWNKNLVPGANGGSVNHGALAAAIALKDGADGAIDWWHQILSDWALTGFWRIETMSRTYWDWLYIPMLVVEKEIGIGMPMLRGLYSYMALGGSHKPAFMGREISTIPVQLWHGYACTCFGARSWVTNDDNDFQHLERHAMDWQMRWAIEDKDSYLDPLPQWQWSMKCIQQGNLGSGIEPRDAKILKSFLVDRNYLENLETLVGWTDDFRVRKPVRIIRTADGVCTIGEVSQNGNTAFGAASTFNHGSQWHEWMGWDDGSRGNVNQGKAWVDEPWIHGESNDGLLSAQISMPTGDKIYEVFWPAQASPSIIVPLGDTPPPTEPPEVEPPPVEPPEDGLTPEDRTKYVAEIEQMSNRQAQLADDLRTSTGSVDDHDVSDQLGHQSNKANRLSNEIEALL